MAAVIRNKEGSYDLNSPQNRHGIKASRRRVAACRPNLVLVGSGLLRSHSVALPNQDRFQLNSHCKTLLGWYNRSIDQLMKRSILTFLQLRNVTFTGDNSVGSVAKPMTLQ